MTSAIQSVIVMAPSGEPTNTRGYRILLIDDDFDDRFIAQRTLK